MRVCSVSSILLAGFLTIGAASGQTPPPADDPHHPAVDEETTATVEAEVAPQPQPPSGEAGMGAMMSPEMMQMMMQMMAQHHVAGSTPGPGIQDGMTGAVGQGSEVVFGLAPAATPETTPDVVRGWLQTQLDSLQNPRLTLGTIETAADGSIIAEIRTVDGALVQRLSFNRYPGFVRQID